MIYSKCWLSNYIGVTKNKRFLVQFWFSTALNPPSDKWILYRIAKSAIKTGNKSFYLTFNGNRVALRGEIHQCFKIILRSSTQFSEHGSHQRQTLHLGLSTVLSICVTSSSKTAQSLGHSLHTIYYLPGPLMSYLYLTCLDLKSSGQKLGSGLPMFQRTQRATHIWGKQVSQEKSSLTNSEMGGHRGSKK